MYESISKYIWNHPDPVCIEYKGLPINEAGDIDLHRPYIDII